VLEKGASLSFSYSKASLQKCASDTIASNNENAVAHYIKENIMNL